MKKFLLYACVALLSCIAFAQTNVVVVLKEGVKKIYEAADVDSIRINKNEGYDAVVVLKNGKEEKYAAKDIDSIKIEKDAPVPAEETGLLFSYYEESNTASVRGIKNYDDASEIKIPSQVVYEGVIYDVTSIKLNAFAYAKYSSIEIPESVTIIGDEAFVYCVNLTSIEIPSSVTKIGRSAFADCQKLKTARVPVGCELGNNAFPSTCKIEWYDPLTGEKIIPAEESFLTFEYDETTMTASVTGVENKDITEVVIPSHVLYNGNVYAVTTIGDNAFEDCSKLTSIEIPNSVTEIGKSAFYNCGSLTSIVIPEPVTTIGDFAFSYCRSLESIEIPSSVTTIGEYAFAYSSLKSIVIPNSVTKIGGYAFEDCRSLTSIVIPESVTEIGKGAFDVCASLTSIEIPNSVTKIGDDAFYGCTGLTSIVVDKDNKVYDSRENCNAIIEIASNALILGCQNTVISNSVTSIASGAFKDCRSLTSIEIPESVTTIGTYAFRGCYKLTSIEIPESVTTIGTYAFYNCTNLRTARVPSGCNVGEGAFPSTCEIEWYDPLTSFTFSFDETSKTAIVTGVENKEVVEVKIPSVVLHNGKEYDVTSIADRVFKDCSSLSSIEIPNSVTYIGVYAFSGCGSLSSIEIPNSVTYIGGYAFSGCGNLKAARLPSSLKGKIVSVFPETCEIEWYDGVPAEETGLSFEYDETAKTASVTGVENKEVAEVTIPSKVLYDGKEYEVTSIGAEAFSACTELASVDIPESVTSIGENAFTSCIGLTSIEIPNSVTEIGASAFSFCTSLTSIEIPSSITSIGEITFFGCKNLKAARVPVGCELGNNAFPSTCEIVWYDPLTGEKIKSYEELGLYFEYDNVTKTLSVKRIKDKSTTKFQIPSHVLDNGKVYDLTVTKIGDEAFSDCRSLISIEIPNSVTTIGRSAFAGCESLESIEIPNSVTTIGEDAFLYCTSLTSIEIPNSVTTIGRSAFADCQNLKTARVPVGCELGKFAFPSTCEIEWYDPLTGEKIVSMEETGLWFNIDRETTTASVRNNYDDPDKRYYFTEVKIPSKAVTYEGEIFDITSIEEGAFKNSTSLTSIEIPESVTSIGAEVFSGCTNLKTARVPVSLKGKVESEFPSTCEIEWY